MNAFCKRNAFRAWTSHEESGDANVESEKMQAALAILTEEFKQYDLNDVFNMNETALMYNMPPRTTIVKERIEGRKKNKTRLTIAFTCNVTGTERFVPFFIDHANKPRCFNKKLVKSWGFSTVITKRHE